MKNKSPFVSIVVPCYNDHSFVKQSVRSALEQAYAHKEVIVVDDGSDVKTKEVLKKLKPIIHKLITQENLGASAARNVGIAKAKGKYILVLDSDDYFEPDFCSKAVAILEKDREIKIVTCYTRRFTEKGLFDIIKPKSADLKEFLKYNCAMGSSMFRKEDWALCGGYDDEMKKGFEDWEFYIRLLEDGGRSVVIPEVLFNYRLRSGSKTNAANRIKYKLYRQIYFKNMSIYIEHFDVLVDHLLSRLEIAEKAEQKNRNKIEFRIGKLLVSPLQKLKRIFS